MNWCKKNYMKKYMKRRYQNEPEFRRRMINYLHDYKMRYPFRAWANQVIQGHKRRKVLVEITRLQLEEMAKREKTCSFCGCILKYGPQNGKKKWHSDSASADRIDNTKPFNKENIQIICVQCNSAKSKMNTEEFREWIKTVYLRMFET